MLPTPGCSYLLTLVSCTVCVLQKNIETDNITSLWGYHSNMMKHMIEQQREEEIKDVFE